MSEIPLYPLKFEPIYQYRIWGGRKLGDLLSTPLPADEPIGEAWILSDRKDHMSIVANGAFKGLSISTLFEEFQVELMGKLTKHFLRFPLLLKFLDAKDLLSVQVHPSDKQIDYLPAGESGKTEAWIVLEAEKESIIYGGLKPETTLENLQQAIVMGTVANHLASFTPKPGDAVFLPAGMVHTLGRNVLVFEIQQNSDVTFRLFDWNHWDSKTGKPRPLQVEQALACIDFLQGVLKPIVPKVETSSPVLNERLFECDYFHVWRLQGEFPFTVGELDAPRILVCLDGQGEIKHNDVVYAVCKGDVFLLPATVGVCSFWPDKWVNLLEIVIPAYFHPQPNNS